MRRRLLGCSLWFDTAAARAVENRSLRVERPIFRWFFSPLSALNCFAPTLGQQLIAQGDQAGAQGFAAGGEGALMVFVVGAAGGRFEGDGLEAELA
jgi:hypothetical protein